MPPPAPVEGTSVLCTHSIPQPARTMRSQQGRRRSLAVCGFGLGHKHKTECASPRADSSTPYAAGVHTPEPACMPRADRSPPYAAGARVTWTASNCYMNYNAHSHMPQRTVMNDPAYGRRTFAYAVFSQNRFVCRLLRVVLLVVLLRTHYLFCLVCFFSVFHSLLASLTCWLAAWLSPCQLARQPASCDESEQTKYAKR